MEGATTPRLHPLLTAAAISVTVFSAVGIGALTGFLPSPRSSTPDGVPSAVQTLAPVPSGSFGMVESVRATATRKWEITVRMDDGSHRTLTSSTAPIWRGGERVRLVDGNLRPA